MAQSSISVPATHAKLFPVVKSTFDSLKESSNVEFEGRIGKFEKRGDVDVFVSGVSKEFFFSVFDLLKNNTIFEASGPFDCGDFFFKNNIRGTSYSENSYDYTFMKKYLIKNINVACFDSSDKLHSYCFRLSEKKEMPVNIENGYDLGVYSEVRIKKRWTFIYKMWKYDLTIGWEGECPESARIDSETKQLREPDVYEIEIEYLPEIGNHHPSNYLAMSMIDKLGDLIKLQGEDKYVRYALLQK